MITSYQFSISPSYGLHHHKSHNIVYLKARRLECTSTVIWFMYNRESLKQHYRIIGRSCYMGITMNVIRITPFE